MPPRKRITEPNETPAPRPGKRGPKPDVKAQKARFLAAFRNVGTIRKACERTKVPRASVNDWLDSDRGFVEEYDLAFDDWVDSLVDLMVSLARGTIQGKRRPNFMGIVALLNAFHSQFDRMGQEKLEKRMFDLADRMARIAARYIPPQDLEKFREECSSEVDAALLGIAARKGKRE